MRNSLFASYIVYLATVVFGSQAWCVSVPSEAPLEEGFRNLYNLEFDAGHARFQSWVFDAAAYLFSEFHRLNILQSQFFTNDDVFEHRNLKPDPEIKRKFEAALERSRQIADAQLKVNPNDENAQFATVMRLGLHADYLSLLEHRDLDALRETKQGHELAEKLVAQHPDNYDAYIAIGVENYLLSLKPAPIR